jgi:hypothetical protein
MTKKNDPIAEGQRLQAEAVAAQEERDKVKPTPTQEEADKAKLGVLEEEGFTPSGEPVEKVSAAEKPAASYSTRAAKAD